MDLVGQVTFHRVGYLLYNLTTGISVQALPYLSCILIEIEYGSMLYLLSPRCSNVLE